MVKTRQDWLFQLRKCQHRETLEKVIEKNETIFEVRTFAGSRDRAKKIVDNWNKNASKIYPKILDLLLLKLLLLFSLYFFGNRQSLS